MRILIAEDDLVSRRLLRNNLIGWGYEVVVAEDGAAAWRLFQDGEPPALAILDWNMPGMDGLEVCRLIRATQHGRQAIYLILLTGRGSRLAEQCPWSRRPVGRRHVPSSAAFLTAAG